MAEIKDNVIELRRVKASELIPNPKNWRTHPEYQREAFATILETIGITDALLARETPDGLMLIDGHLRADMMPDQLVPVLVVDLDDAAADIALGTHDVIGNLAGQEAALLASLAEGINHDDKNVEARLRGLIELQKDQYRMLEPAPLPREESFDTGDALDAAEAEAYMPFSARGQIWRLGDHRLMCGDATSADDVEAVGVKANLMVTDPPYGVEYTPEWRNDRSQAGATSMGPPGARAMGKPLNDDNDNWAQAWQLFKGDVAYVWHASLHGPAVMDSLAVARFTVRAQIIWNKNHIAISRGHYHWKHEPCWYAVRNGGTATWVGDRKQATVWDIDRNRANETDHSTQKPVECMERPIRNHEGDVYDPFVGSGTTIIAAEKLGRRCYAMEIEPRYCDVAIRRWEAFTGQKAEQVS